MHAPTPTRPPRTPLVPPRGHDLHVRDMSATFAADLAAAEVDALLAAHEQWLPVDGDRAATLERLVDINSSGPLRLGYGAWRDLLLGAQFLNRRGQLITAGGRVVKNVAGYDLTKLMVGQHGRFGRLLTITVRTYRRPSAALLLEFSPDPGRVGAMMTTPMRPHWAILDGAALRCGYLGDAQAIDYFSTEATALAPRRVLRQTLDDDVALRQSLWKAGDLRVSVPPARLGEFFAAWTGPCAADAAFGVVVGEWSEADRPRLRDAAARAGGRVLPDDYADRPATRALVDRLSAAFGGVA